jgi:hypothetical protein
MQQATDRSHKYLGSRVFYGKAQLRLDSLHGCSGIAPQRFQSLGHSQPGRPPPGVARTINAKLERLVLPDLIGLSLGALRSAALA